MDHTTWWMMIGGALAVGISLIAWIGDHRRVRRRELDRVGFMPWTGLFFWSTMIAVLLLGVALKRLL